MSIITTIRSLKELYHPQIVMRSGDLELIQSARDFRLQHFRIRLLIDDVVDHDREHHVASAVDLHIA